MSKFYLPTDSSQAESSAASSTSSRTHSPHNLAINTSTNNHTTPPYLSRRISTLSGSSNSADSDDDLPYPQALPRSDFLKKDFSATEYLSSLSNRHQTLEDLRSDLRERSQLLSKELLDLVNVNYEAFLSLGHELKGGEEKIEDVRVGLLGFSRGVKEVKGVVGARREKVEGLIGEKAKVRKEVEVGRKLLELDECVEDLEGRLMVESTGKIGVDGDEDAWSADDSDEDEDATDLGLAGAGVRKLQGLVKDWMRVEALAENVGREHPFVRGLDVRMIKVKNTLMLDLGTALKAARRSVDAKEDGSRERLLTIMSCFDEMGEEKEAIKFLKSLKS